MNVELSAEWYLLWKEISWTLRGVHWYGDLKTAGSTDGRGICCALLDWVMTRIPRLTEPECSDIAWSVITVTLNGHNTRTKWVVNNYWHSVIMDMHAKPKTMYVINMAMPMWPSQMSTHVGHFTASGIGQSKWLPVYAIYVAIGLCMGKCSIRISGLGPGLWLMSGHLEKGSNFNSIDLLKHLDLGYDPKLLVPQRIQLSMKVQIQTIS